MTTIMNYLGIGGVVFVILTVFVEITPIKINPIQWLGNRFNSGMREDIAKLEVKVERVDSKIDEHVAESYRNNILAVQDRLLKNERFTREEWKKALKSCQAYDRYIESNDLDNDLVEEAMKYIHRQYQKALNNSDFSVLPQN